jgi:hypothetical protein
VTQCTEEDIIPASDGSRRVAGLKAAPSNVIGRANDVATTRWLMLPISTLRMGRLPAPTTG